MNRKQFAILVVLLVVLGGVGLIVQNHHGSAADASSHEEVGKLLGENFPVNDVALIKVQQGTNELALAKQNDLWRLPERGGYPADFSKITEFLIKVAGLKVLETEQVDVGDLARLQLAATGQGSGVSLTFADKDGKTIKALTLGKSHFPKSNGQRSPFGEDESFPDGRYVMRAGDTQDVLLVADALSEMDQKPDQWLKKDFFKIERPKAIAVSYPITADSWQLVRDAESGDWKLSGLKTNETENTTNVPSVINPFVSPSFEDVMAPDTKPELTGLDKPTTVTVDTFDDFTYTIKVGKKDEGNYPITMSIAANFPKVRIPAAGEKPEDRDKADKAWADRQKQLDATLKQQQAYENWIYLVPAWTVDAVLKERGDLVMEKKPETKPAAASDAASASKDDTSLPLTLPDPLGAKK